MTSLANPPLLQKWIAFVVERANPFKGMGLIPLEAQPFITACEKAILLKERGKGGDLTLSEWQLMVNHHKVGGFRQIVLHKGKLIFTRMAQPIGESMPEVIAGNIEQEITNTIEYLKRLGLQGPDFMSVVIVAAEDIKKVLDSKRIKAGSYHFFTPFELAELLAITDAAQPEDQFGDVVISAFVGKRSKLMLSLTTTYIRKLLNYSRYIMATRLAAALGILGILGWAGSSGYDIYTTKNDIEALQATQSSLQAKLNATKQRAQSLPKNINAYTDLETIARLYSKRRIDPMLFISNFADALEDDALVSSYQWNLSSPMDVTKDADKRQVKAEIQIRMTAPLEPHNVFIAEAETVLARISAKLPDYDVSHPPLPGVLPENQDLKTIIDDTNNTVSPTATTLTDNTVKLTITGPKAPAPATPGARPGMPPGGMPPGGMLPGGVTR
jgi:cell division protein FtsB